MSARLTRVAAVLWLASIALVPRVNAQLEETLVRERPELLAEDVAAPIEVERTPWSEAPPDAPDEERTTEAPEESARVPYSLPEGTTAGSVGPQSIPLPTGEGAVEGMGESFTPALSSGTG